MALVLANVITSCRILANDTPTSNFIPEETPKGLTDGSNTKFRLQYQNIVATSVYISYGSTFRTTTGFTVDLVNGILTFTPAPANGVKLLADYNFQWFTDADWTEFLAQAALQLGSSTDVTTVNPGLQQALEQYALYNFYMRRATRYADKYASTGGQASQQVETVTQNFLNLAKNAMKMGDKFRTDYYEKQGQQKNPSGTVVAMQFDPMSPRR